MAFFEVGFLSRPEYSNIEKTSLTFIFLFNNEENLEPKSRMTFTISTDLVIKRLFKDYVE